MILRGLTKKTCQKLRSLKRTYFPSVSEMMAEGDRRIQEIVSEASQHAQVPYSFYDYDSIRRRWDNARPTDDPWTVDDLIESFEIAGIEFKLTLHNDNNIGLVEVYRGEETHYYNAPIDADKFIQSATQSLRDLVAERGDRLKGDNPMQWAEFSERASNFGVICDVEVTDGYTEVTTRVGGHEYSHKFRRGYRSKSANLHPREAIR